MSSHKGNLYSLRVDKYYKTTNCGKEENMNTIKEPSDLRTVSIRTRQHGEEKSFFYLRFKYNGNRLRAIVYVDQFGVCRIAPFRTKILHLLYSHKYTRIHSKPQDEQDLENLLKYWELLNTAINKKIYLACVTA